MTPPLEHSLLQTKLVTNGARTRNVEMCKTPELGAEHNALFHRPLGTHSNNSRMCIPIKIIDKPRLQTIFSVDRTQFEQNDLHIIPPGEKLTIYIEYAMANTHLY